MQRAVESPSLGLFLDPGLGKTSIVLEAFRRIKERNPAARMLVIAPLRVAQIVWPDEIKKWGFSFSFALAHGRGKERIQFQDYDITLINVDGLKWLFSTASPETWDVVCVDELTKFKHSQSQRFKAMRDIWSKFKQRWGLTGTPLGNGYHDLFGQMFVLDSGKTLGKYITHFRDNFFHKGWNGFTWELNSPAHGSEILRRISPMVMRMAAEDYLSMPPVIHNTIEVRLPEKVMAEYQSLLVTFMAEVGTETLYATSAAVKAGKLLQMATGYIYVEGGKDVYLHDQKKKAVEELHDELNGAPLLVMYQFNSTLSMFPGVPVIKGGMGATAVKEIVDKWNKGNIPMLLIQPQAAAHGLNLQYGGRHVCWMTPTWDYELYDQANRRIWRAGVEGAVTIHHIVAKDTIDRAVIAAVTGKQMTQGEAFRFICALQQQKGTDQ